jgi:ribose/xylose/arabinose/galactoside ABC-type transport system permease subunit
MSASSGSPSASPLAGRRTISLIGSALGPFLGLLLVLAVFSVADYARSINRGKKSTFASEATAQKVLRDASQVGVAALGMTLIIIAGGIDLSAGATISLCATVTAWFFRENYSPAVGVAAAVLIGCLAGFLNGVLISSLRVVPFIVTLGTMTVFFGLGLILANDTPIRAFGKVPDWVLNLQAPYPIPDWLGVSSGVWVMIALAGAVGVLLKYTVHGRHVFALGSNEATARLCGVNVTAVRIAVYTIAGLFVGVAGLFQFAILSGEGDPLSGTGKELEIIAAVVIGGGSLNGGRGSILGTLSGACIMAAIRHGCVTLDITTAYQKVILGIIIVAAVTLDQIRQRRMAA